MPEYIAITANPLPDHLHGSENDFSIRTLSHGERLLIEDYFFAKASKLSLAANATAVVVAQPQAGQVELDDFGMLIEFALAILSITGFEPIAIVALMTATACTRAEYRSHDRTLTPPTFPKRMVRSAPCAWVRHLFRARLKTKDKLHITAYRFVRYSKAKNIQDALVELCICLESLIEAQTEISFRFSVCLANVAKMKDPHALSALLTDLYSFRSSVVHGTDSTKELKKVEPNTAELRRAARAILTAYILFLTENTKDDWKKHLRHSLLKYTLVQNSSA